MFPAKVSALPGPACNIGGFVPTTRSIWFVTDASICILPQNGYTNQPIVAEHESRYRGAHHTNYGSKDTRSHDAIDIAPDSTG